MKVDLQALRAQVEAMSPANRLRLAAGLIEARKYDLAEVIAGNVVDELKLLQLLEKV